MMMRRMRHPLPTSPTAWGPLHWQTTLMELPRMKSFVLAEVQKLPAS